MSKQRFLGGLLGANPVRDGSFTDTIFSETNGPLRFDDPTYGAINSDCSMGPYNANGITLTNSGTAARIMGIDLNLAGFTDSFFVIISNPSGLPGPTACQIAVSTYGVSAFSLTSGADLGLVAGTARIRHNANGFQANTPSVSVGGHESSGANAMCVAYDNSNKQIYFGYLSASGGNVSWLKGSGTGSQGQSASWTTTLPTSDPTFDTDSFNTNTGQAIKSLLIQLPAGGSVTYHAENWFSTNTPAGFNELRNAPYSSGTTVVDRTTSNVGILSLDEAGPEDNGTSLSLSQMNWGGISGRSAVIETTNPSLDLNFDGTTSSYTRATTAEDAAKANGDQLATSILTQGKTGTVQSMYMGPNGKLIKGYVTNLLTQSSDLTHADWAVANSLSVSVSGVGPDGSTDAFLLDDQTATYGRLSQAMTAAAGTYTASIFVKKTASAASEFSIRLASAVTTNHQVFVDTQNGNISGSSTGTITPVGTDWYRVSVSITTPSSGTLTLQIWPAHAPTYNGGASAAATGSKTVWGAQLEEGAAPSQYVSTSGTSASEQVARIEYDASGNPLGLLVEEIRENFLTNSQMNPTGGSGYTHINNPATVTTGADTDPTGKNGASLITPDSGTSAWYGGEHLSYTAGTSYTFSTYVKVPTGSTFDGRVQILISSSAFNNGNGNVSARWQLETDGTAAFQSSGNDPEDYGIIDAGNGWYRVWLSHTCTTSSTVAAQLPRVDQIVATTDTLLQWGAQIEEGEGAPTSIIPTTSGAATRPADVITLATADFGFDAANMSVVIDATATTWSSGGNFPRFFEFRGASSGERVYGRMSYGKLQLGHQDLAGTGASYIHNFASGLTYPIQVQFGSSHTGTDFSYAIDGALSASDTTSGMSSALTTLELGGQVSLGGNTMNGHIRRFTYWPRALSARQLAEYSGDLDFSGSMENTGILSLNELLQVNY